MQGALGDADQQGHDLREFNEAFRRFAPLALASANRVLRDEAAAEDVVQDVFVQLWMKPDSYDPARGSTTRSSPLSCARVCWVRMAMVPLSSVGSA